MLPVGRQGVKDVMGLVPNPVRLVHNHPLTEKTPYHRKRPTKGVTVVLKNGVL